MKHPTIESTGTARARQSRPAGERPGGERAPVVNLRPDDVGVRPDDVDLRDDDIVSSLTALMDALRRSAGRVQQAQAQGARTTRLRLEGVPYREIVASAPRPLLIDMATFDLEAIATAGVRFRRATARALFEEGMTVDQIAKELEVSHQRISRLLHADPDAPGPTWTATRDDRMRAREESRSSERSSSVG